MPRLSLALLGRPQARLAGEAIRFPTRKTFGLLIYLAASLGRHSRERLMALLWPESDAPHAQASLRNTLARLRRALPATGAPYLLADDDSAGFNFEADWDLDLDALSEMAVAQGNVDTLAAATEVYRGEFLADFRLPDAPDFEAWAGEQREYWRRQQCRALERLAQLQSESGDSQAATATARRWMATDPLNEAAYRALMRLEFAAGDKSGALATHGAARETLARELGIEPTLETEALAARIRREAAPQSRRAGQPAASGGAGELPFVGRAAEFARLIELYAAARAGRAQLALIEGEAGIGKTRLAGEFMAWAGAEGADVVRGRAFEAGGRLPYQPVVDAIRARLDRENAPDDLLDDAWLAELSRLLPELRERYPDLPQALLDESLAAGRLMEAVARLTLALAARRPLVFFLDDLQWADTASMDLLHYLARRWAAEAAPILWLGTLRSEALAYQPAVRDWLAHLGRAGGLARLPLAAITPDELRKLVDRLASGGAAGLAEWLFSETRGQPLYLSETFKVLAERGALDPTTGGWSMASAGELRGLIPPGARDVILYRLRRLSPAASRLLAAAAVLGRSLSFERLCAVAETDTREALPALDELLASRILVEQGQRAGTAYEFAHDKIRDVAYTEAGEARRRHTHRLAYAALLADGAPEAELAHHAQAARMVEPALRHSLAAGNAALAVFAVRDAIALYEQARQVEAAERPPALFARLGRAYELNGDQAAAQAAYQEMLDGATATGDTEQACAALNHLATVAIHRYDFAAAAGWLERALAVATESGSTAALADTEWSLAQLHHHQYDFQGSRAHSARALALARELGNAELTAGSLNALGYAEMLIGEVAAGSAHMEEARDRYRQLGNRALEADCLSAMAGARLWLGELEASLAASGEARAICEAIENPWGLVFSGIWRAAALLDQGEYEAALALAEAGEAQARAHDFVPLRIFNLLTLGRVRRALMQPEAAHGANLAAKEVNDHAPAGPFAAMISTALCGDAVDAGDWEAGLANARAAAALRSYAALPLVVPRRWPETAALLRGGERELAEADARRWGGLVRDVPRLYLAHLRSLALLARGEQARTHLEEAAELAAGLGLLGELWPICAAMGQTERAAAIVNTLAEKYSRWGAAGGLPVGRGESAWAGDIMTLYHSTQEANGS